MTWKVVSLFKFSPNPWSIFLRISLARWIQRQTVEVLIEFHEEEKGINSRLMPLLNIKTVLRIKGQSFDEGLNDQETLEMKFLLYLDWDLNWVINLHSSNWIRNKILNIIKCKLRGELFLNKFNDLLTLHSLFKIPKELKSRIYSPRTKT